MSRATTIVVRSDPRKDVSFRELLQRAAFQVRTPVTVSGGDGSPVCLQIEAESVSDSVVRFCDAIGLYVVMVRQAA